MKLTFPAFLVLAALAGCGVSTGTTASNTPTPTHNITPTPSGTPAKTPTPTPSPTAVPPVTQKSGTVCSFVWENADPDTVDFPNTIDFYEVDIGASYWKNTTTAFDGTNEVGYFVIAYDPSANTFLDAGMTTSGTFTLSVSTTAMGIAASFTNAASTDTFFDATNEFDGSSTSLGGKVATGGTGTFSGKLSNPSPTAPITPGTGNVTVTDNADDVEEFADPTDPTSATYAACTPPS